MEVSDDMTADFSPGVKDSLVVDEKTILKTKQVENMHRYLLVFFTVLYVLFYSGAFFGYGPLQLMLEDSGAFRDECQEGEEMPCPAQTLRLLQVHFCAQLTLMFTPLAGVIADRYSAKMLMYLVAAVGIMGLILLLLATGFHVNNLLFLSDFLLGLMATSTSVTVVQTGLLFQTVTRQRVISALNTLFDSGALTYLALWAIENALDCGITAIVGGYLGVAVVCYGGAVYYWRIVVPVQEDDTVPCLEMESGNSSILVDEKEERPTNAEQDVSNEITSTENQAMAQEDYSQVTESKPATTTYDKDYVLIADRALSRQLKSKLYIYLCAFFAIHGTKNNFTLTTARDTLAFMGDDKTGNKYLTIFTLLTPASILGLPFMDYMLNNYGYHAGFQSINILSLAHGIILTSTDNLNVQVLGFLIFSFFRCFFFTVSFSFVPTFLGQSVVGRGSGILMFWFGLLSFVNIGLSNWAVNGLGGNFFWPNLILTLAVVPCIVLAWLMGKCIRQEQQVKEELKGG